ncbi:MAG TPA: hypothetical protein DD727_03510 [Clostridiales bacterium]|nr:hypothetical protein [Clostridiales bacterium]
MYPDSKNEPLKPGDRLYILMKGKSAATTNVVSIIDEYTCLIEEALMRGKRMPMNPGDDLDVFFYREDGIYSFRGIVNEAVSRYGVRLYKISVSGETFQKQRRAFHRLQRNLPVSITLNVDKNQVIRRIDIQARTLDISAGGSRIELPDPIGKDTSISCRITLTDNRDLNLSSVVVRVIEGDQPGDLPQIGVKFKDMDERSRQELVKFISEEQHRQTGS